MFADIDLDQAVPDAIYLTSLEHAVTLEEVAFRDVLTFHRDCLNGGLDQAFDNREGTSDDLALVFQAYRTVGLSDVASLLDEAVITWRVEDDIEKLTDRYTQFTYGEENDQPDAVERAVMQYAQLHEGAFASISGAAARGDFKTVNFGRLAW